MDDNRRIKNRLDEMESGLYRRDRKNTPMKRSKFSSKKPKVENAWGRTEPLVLDEDRASHSKLGLLLIGSVIFFAAALVLALTLFSSGRNVISSDNIDVAITGPVSVKGGEEVSLQLVITNKNNAKLEFVDLAVSYPTGTLDPEDLTENLDRENISLGTIRSGETVKKTIKGIIFGDENEEKRIDFSLEYRTAGSNAIFETQKSYEFIVSSAPVQVSFSFPDEINTGQTIEIETQVSSNSTDELEEIYLDIEYPRGFDFRSASPEPEQGNNLWGLGDVTPGTSKTIKIKGVISGDENESKAFRATVGLLDERTDKVNVPYASAFEEIVIKQPFIDLILSVNGDDSLEISTEPGDRLRGDIFWQNKLEQPLDGAELQVKFEGNILDKSQVSVTRGFFRSSDNTIIWKPQDESALQSILPGEEGRVNFDFGTVSNSIITSRNITNPELNVTVTLIGTREVAGRADEEIITRDTKSIKLESLLQIATQSLHQSGPFVNTGPLPPRVDQETTYTIIWTAANTSNDVEGAIVRATLPTYVEWRGNVSPDGANISYNDVNGQIVWELDDVAANTGSAIPPREVAFQIALTPGSGQDGNVLELVSAPSITGQDVFTGSVLSGTGKRASTLLNEPNFDKIDSVVTE